MNLLTMNLLIIQIGTSIVSVYIFVRLALKLKRIYKRRSYEKDVVILHQIPRGLRAPSPSPFALKLETWLRAAKIPYNVSLSFIFFYRYIK